MMQSRPLLLLTALLATLVGGSQVGVAGTLPAPPGCKTARIGVASANAPILTVDPSSTWRPRGGLVLVPLKGDAGVPASLVLRACFSWHRPQGIPSIREAEIQLRPSNVSGQFNLGIEVPDLERVRGDWPQCRWHGEQLLAGLGIVPLASLRVIGSGNGDIMLDEVRDVGVTSFWFAIALTAGCVCLLLAVLNAMARRRGVLSVIPAMPEKCMAACCRGRQGCRAKSYFCG